MLRVLTLSTLFPDASRPNFGIFVERQTAALAARPDTQVRVVAPVGLPPWPLTLHPRFRALAALPLREGWRGLDVSRPRFPALPATRGRFHAPLLARALVPVVDRLRDEEAFDVIDASFFFPDGPAAVALGRRYGVPVSIKARGADIHHWGRQPATAAQVRAAGRAADGLLAVSAAMARDMAVLGLPAPRVHLTGVDPAFSPDAAGEAGPRPLVVSLGALIPRKGHDIVVEAAAALPGVHLWIVGAGPERARLEAQVRRLGVGDRVRLIGTVPHGRLPAVLAGADVMALATASEGLANAWVEALACGTPVVTTDIGGARELLTPASGRMVARDAAAFAAAIAELLADPPARAVVAEAAAPFSWSTNAAALHDHLAGLVAAARRQPSG